LVAVEPTSLALLCCAKTGDRTAAAWQKVLTPFTQLEYVNSDAGGGIAAGVRAVATARTEAARTEAARTEAARTEAARTEAARTEAARTEAAPTETQTATETAPGTEVPLYHGLDIFHTGMEAQQVLRRHWRRAEAAFVKAEKAEVALREAMQQGRTTPALAGSASQHWRRAKKALLSAERVEAAWQRIRAALAVFRSDGTLNDRASAEAEIAAALRELSDAEWRKTRAFLKDPRTFTFLDLLHKRLPEAVPDDRLRQACLRRWWLRRQGPMTARAADTSHGPILQLLDAVVRDGALTVREQHAYKRVCRVLAATVRASSAVEGINSVLRMQQCRHRRTTQGLLDLKRLYWNCRKLPTGRRRGRSPYEILGVKLPSTDFCYLLKTPPQELAQTMST
jgi:hypothetical protein